MNIRQILFAVFILGVFGSGIAAATKPTFKIPPEASENIIQGVRKCITKLGLDSKVIKQLKEGKYSDSDDTIEALICMNTESGIGTADGRIIVDKAMNNLFLNKPEIRLAMEVCEKDYGKDPVENLRIFLLCFREEIPVDVLL